MTKRFCDNCGKECKPRTHPNGGYYTVSAVREDGPKSDFDFCRKCWDNFVFSFKRKQ